mgnify:CR=1 FL=1
MKQISRNILGAMMEVDICRNVLDYSFIENKYTYSKLSV